MSAVKISWIFYGTSVGPALGFKCFLHEIAECSDSSFVHSLPRNTANK